MAKARSSTQPPERTSKTDAAPTSRRTIEVRPSWLDEGEARPTYQRVTTEVDPAWLEEGSRPPPSVRGKPAKKGAKPPPLPQTDSVEEDEAPQRSAMPPPLPPPPKKA